MKIRSYFEWNGNRSTVHQNVCDITKAVNGVKLAALGIYVIR